MTQLLLQNLSPTYCRRQFSDVELLLKHVVTDVIITNIKIVHLNFGDSDVSDIVMLVTLWWWLIWDVGCRNIILATFFVMLVIFSMYQIGHEHLKPVTNTFGLQHPSPTTIIYNFGDITFAIKFVADIF